MAATHGITIRLGLQDADVVKRALQQVGAEGEQALRRIDAAANPIRAR